MVAAVLALLPFVVIKVYGYCQEESERQGQEKKEKACRGAGEVLTGSRRKVHIVERGQISLTPVLSVSG